MSLSKCPQPKVGNVRYKLSAAYNGNMSGKKCVQNITGKCHVRNVYSTYIPGQSQVETSRYPHSILYSMYTFYKRSTAKGILTSYGNITVSFYDSGFAFYRIDQYPHKGGVRWWLYVLYVCTTLCIGMHVTDQYFLAFPFIWNTL
jgi:hypothetical protein